MSYFDRNRRVAIVGAGVMGTRVAWACARAGIPTVVYDVTPGRSEQACVEARSMAGIGDGMLVAAGTLEEALQGAQLAFENAPEQLALKCELLAQIGGLLNADAWMGSNTSSLPCAPLAEASGRPERFFNMNFSNPQTSRLVELMGCERTSQATLQFATQWAESMGMVALHVARDQMGYAHNRLWRVIKREVLRQIATGTATPEDIDRAWMLSFGDDIGPCGIMDEVGLRTILAVEETYAQLGGDPDDPPPSFLRQMVADGKTGVAAGEGFYTYPDPAFARPDFIRSTLSGK